MTEAEHMGAGQDAARHLTAQPFVATQAKAGTE
jgi:hypothetical protein